jgi:hypothetical protein
VTRGGGGGGRRRSFVYSILQWVCSTPNVNGVMFYTIRNILILVALCFISDCMYCWIYLRNSHKVHSVHTCNVNFPAD